MSSPSDFTGAIATPVTPFNKDLALDLDALARNVDEMAKYAFCAIVAAGGIGELYSLSPVEVEQVVKTTVENAHGKPVIAGTGFNTMIGADLARRAERAGAECLLVRPPYYNAPAGSALFEYYRTIGSATPLPLIVSSGIASGFTSEHVSHLADRVPTLAGWMDGQGDFENYRRILERLGDRLAWFGGIGDDCFPDYFSIGAQACASSIANISPKLSIELAECAMAGDADHLDHFMQRYVRPLYAIVERHRGYEVSVIKSAMDILGMEAGAVRPPLENCHPQDVADLRALMDIYRDWGSLSLAK